MKNFIFAEIVCDFLFPRRCSFCGKVIKPHLKICNSCLATAQRINDACSACGLPKKLCGCGGRAHFYDAAACAYIYDDVVKRGILHYKNGGDKRAVQFFAAEMAELFYAKSNFMVDYIAYIPHTAKETRDRGFDQNRELAMALSEQMHVPVYEHLVKIYETSPQKSLPYLYKKGNIAGVFDLDAPNSAAGKSFILTDDIKTTGATIDECAKMLKLYDADKIFALTFAAALPRTEKNKKTASKNSYKVKKQ